jgi:cell wall-associated NlpC family hydrolase
LRGRALTFIAMLASMAVFATPALAQDPAPPEAPPVPAPPVPAPLPTGGVEFGAEEPVFQPAVAGAVAQIVDGVAYAPADAPDAVKQAIWAANTIVGRPYKYGGGHGRGFEDDGYDCSGTVSYALRAASLLRVPRDSTSFLRWGVRGKGQWITVYTRASHAFVVIAGLRLDTSAAGDPRGGKGPRWRPTLRSTVGFRARHAVGL